MCVSSDMSKNIWVVRSEKSFFIFFIKKEWPNCFPTNFAYFTSEKQYK